MARTKQARILTNEERLDLWAEMNQPHRMIAQICYFTASRIDEVCQLEAKDLTDGGKTLRFRPVNAKRGKGKAVSISPELRRLMDEYSFQRDGYLFPRGDGHKPVKATHKWSWDKEKEKQTKSESGEVRQCISRQAFDKELRRAADLTLGEGHGVSTHSFRRSMCDRLYREHPKSVRSIMAISGHRSLESFLRYIGQSTADDLAIEAALNGYQ